MNIARRLLLVSSMLLAASPALAQVTRTVSLSDLFKKKASDTEQPATPPAPQDDLARVRQLYAGDFIATRLPGIYAAKSPSGYSMTAGLVTPDGQLMMNNGTVGMTRGLNGPRLNEAEQEAVIRPLLPYFGTDTMIQFGPRESPLRMVLASAVDCGYCAKLEPALAARNLRYAVIPGAMSEENMGLVHRIYCSADPGKAWLQLLSRREGPALESAHCDFDREHFWVLRGLLGGTTPRLVFADGDLMLPTPDPAGVARVEAKLNELERAGIAFD